MSEERDRLPHSEMLLVAQQATTVLARMKVRAAEALEPAQAVLE